MGKHITDQRQLEGNAGSDQDIQQIIQIIIQRGPGYQHPADMPSL